MKSEAHHEVAVGLNLKRVLQGNLCAGCGACAGLFPQKLEMDMSSPGFLRPRSISHLTEIEDNRLASFCPGLGQRMNRRGRLDHTLWGPYVAMRRGWSCDAHMRFAGASGGALSSLLLYLVETEKVDAVVEIGADPRSPIGNETIITVDRAGILTAAGSRYAPSAPLSQLKELVATGMRYAFVGKPCDVVALRALSEQEPEIAATFPVLLSFFCAGVPSESGARALLRALGADEEATERFRYRGHGWPGRATAVLKNGDERSMSYHESWGGILSKHVQLRCKICADGTGMAADIVCADAWESDAAGYPLFEEAEGSSLIVSRTDLGERILKRAQEAGHIEMVAFDVNHLASIQPGQRERRRALLARLLALRLTGRPVPHYRGLHLWRSASQNSVLLNLKNFMGMARRVISARFKKT